MKPPPTAFSWDLRINGTSVSVPFGNLKFSRTVDGFGTSGISTGQFEFDIYDEFGQYSEGLLAGVSARLYESNNKWLPSREYYITKRTVSKKICHFVCYDVMSKTDKNLDISDWIFPENNPKKTVYDVLNAIKNQAGFADISYSATAGLDEISFTEEQLTNKKIRGIMEMVAAAMCGVWVADSDGGAVLSCFGAPYDHISEASEYAEIDFQGKQKITKLIVTDSETGKITEYSTGEYGTVITVDTPFPGTANAVWTRISGAEYTGWNCEKAIISDISPDLPIFTKIGFGENSEFMASSFTVSVDSTGVYFSGGQTAQPDEEWAYESYVQRELSQKIEIEKSVGNTKISVNGDIIFKNNNEGGGLKNVDNGISYYRRKRV